jgi:hypothetical protein
VKVSEQLTAARGRSRSAGPSSTVTLPLGEPAPGATTETEKLTDDRLADHGALGLRFETATRLVSALST